MFDHLKPGMRLRAHGPALEEVPVVTTAPSGTAKIVFAASGLSVPCDGSETVLAVARRSGPDIPSSCNFGLCGTCKIRKTGGEVVMVHNGGISDDEIAEGLILACC